jgi:hypothetical protein
VKDWTTVLFRAAPGTEDTFKIDLKSPMLCEKDHKLFHMTVAKMLYIAKCFRANALTVTSFLCTRVTKATDEDQCKLERLLGCFLGGLPLHISCSTGASLEVLNALTEAYPDSMM